MDKRTIYSSLGFAAVLVIALGTLNFSTDTQFLRGTLEYAPSGVIENPIAEASEEAVISSSEYCPTDSNSSSFEHLGPEPVNFLDAEMTYNGVELDSDKNVTAIQISIGEESYTFDVNDSYTGFIGMSSVIGDNVGFSDGSISFAAPSELGNFSMHFRYLDLNEAILEINGRADCLPYRSSVVMLPCEDCKVRTLVNNQTVGLMLNQDHLLISNEAFSGSTVTGNPVGIDLSGLDLDTELQSVDTLSSVDLSIDSDEGEQEGEGLDLEFSMATSFVDRLEERRFVIINEL